MTTRAPDMAPEDRALHICVIILEDVGDSAFHKSVFMDAMSYHRERNPTGLDTRSTKSRRKAFETARDLGFIEGVGDDKFIISEKIKKKLNFDKSRKLPDKPRWIGNDEPAEKKWDKILEEPKSEKIVTILGCGGIGSYLAYYLTLVSLEKNFMDKLVLIDEDCIDPKNIPYLFINEEEINNISFMSKPKIFALKVILNQVNKALKIIGVHGRYPEILENLPKNISIKEIESSFLIDCRDTSDEIDCQMKLNLDGKFGMVNLNPKKKKGEKKSSSRYRIGFFRSYAYSFASICGKLVYNEILRKRVGKKLIINLEEFEGEGLHEIVDKELSK